MTMVLQPMHCLSTSRVQYWCVHMQNQMQDRSYIFFWLSLNSRDIIEISSETWFFCFERHAWKRLVFLQMNVPEKKAATNRTTIFFLTLRCFFICLICEKCLFSDFLIDLTTSSLLTGHWGWTKRAAESHSL